MTSLPPPSHDNRPVIPVFSRMTAKAGWIIAATTTLLAVFLACRIVTFDTEARLLRSNTELAQIETQSLKQQLEAERILAARQIADLKAKPPLEVVIFVRLAPPEATSSGPFAIIAWLPTNQTGVFFSEQLPPCAPDEEYRLWIESASGGPVSAGGITVGPAKTTKVEFRPTRPVAGGAKRFILTRERTGGVGLPTRAVVLVGAP